MIRLRTVLSYGLVLAAAAGLTASAFSIARSNAQQAPAEQPAVAAPAVRPTQIGALGTVEPPGGTISIASSSGGVIVSSPPNPGDAVSKGAVLVQLDDRLARARLEQLRVAVSVAEAQLKDAEGTRPGLEADVAAAQAILDAATAQRDDAAEELSTAQQLAKDSTSVTKRELGRRAAALRTAEAQVAEAAARLDRARADLAAFDPDTGSKIVPLIETINSAEAAVATAEAELAQLTIISPVDGEVLALSLVAGEFAPIGGEILKVGATGPRDVRAEVAEADIPLIGTGAKAWGIVRGSGDERIPLTFVRQDPLVRPKTTLSGAISERVDTRVVDVVFRAPAESRLLPGQVIDVLIDTTEK